MDSSVLLLLLLACPVGMRVAMWLGTRREQQLPLRPCPMLLFCVPARISGSNRPQSPTPLRRHVLSASCVSSGGSWGPSRRGG